MQAGRASAIDRLQLEDGTREQTESRQSRQRQAELAGPGRTRAPTTPRPPPMRIPYPVSRIPYLVSHIIVPFPPKKKAEGAAAG